MTETYSSEDARRQWGDLLIDTVRGKTSIITRYGKPFAAVVPFEQWAQMTSTDQSSAQQTDQQTDQRSAQNSTP